MILHNHSIHSRSLRHHHGPLALRNELRCFKSPPEPKSVTIHDFRASELLVPMVLVYLYLDPIYVNVNPHHVLSF